MARLIVAPADCTHTGSSQSPDLPARVLLPPPPPRLCPAAADVTIARVSAHGDRPTGEGRGKTLGRYSIVTSTKATGPSLPNHPALTLRARRIHRHRARRV